MKQTELKQHALKIESLNLRQGRADLIEHNMHEFLESIGFSNDRIEHLECRSRDGFSPYSHNLGGLQAIAFDQCNSIAGSGRLSSMFEKSCDAVEYANKLNEKWFRESKDIKPDQELTEDQECELYEYSSEADDSILFGCDVMLTSETSLNIRLTISVTDAPYHRTFDDLISIDINFKNMSDLKRGFKNALKSKKVQCFKSSMVDSF